MDPQTCDESYTVAVKIEFYKVNNQISACKNTVACAGDNVFIYFLYQAVLEMSQRQKELQAADGHPPAGPNGELQFQPETHKPEVKGKQN